MTAASEIRDVPAFVRQRLLNLARAQPVDFNLPLHRFAAERLLYRLSASDEVDRSTQVWPASGPWRPGSPARVGGGGP